MVAAERFGTSSDRPGYGHCLRAQPRYAVAGQLAVRKADGLATRNSPRRTGSFRKFQCRALARDNHERLGRRDTRPDNRRACFLVRKHGAADGAVTRACHYLRSCSRRSPDRSHDRDHSLGALRATGIRHCLAGSIPWKGRGLHFDALGAAIAGIALRTALRDYLALGQDS